MTLKIGKLSDPSQFLKATLPNKPYWNECCSKSVTSKSLFTTPEFNKRMRQGRKGVMFLTFQFLRNMAICPTLRRVESELWGQKWNVDMSLSALVFLGATIIMCILMRWFDAFVITHYSVSFQHSAEWTLLITNIIYRIKVALCPCCSSEGLWADSKLSFLGVEGPLHQSMVLFSCYFQSTGQGYWVSHKLWALF